MWTPHGDPGWPAYTADRQLTRIFDVPGEVTAYPEQASYRIWRDDPFDALTS